MLLHFPRPFCDPSSVVRCILTACTGRAFRVIRSRCLILHTSGCGPGHYILFRDLSRREQSGISSVHKSSTGRRSFPADVLDSVIISPSHDGPLLDVRRLQWGSIRRPDNPSRLVTLAHYMTFNACYSDLLTTQEHQLSVHTIPFVYPSYNCTVGLSRNVCLYHPPPRAWDAANFFSRSGYVASIESTLGQPKRSLRTASLFDLDELVRLRSRFRHPRYTLSYQAL